MNVIKPLLRLIWGRPQTHSYMLQLPLEIILKILALLPPYTQLLAYQTCRPLRAIIYQRFLAGKGEILATWKDTLLYLTHLSRSLPDRYLQRLIAPYHSQIKWRFDIDQGISAWRSVYPKVVDGRYLLCSIWTYLEGQTKVSQQSIRYIFICPHIRTFEMECIQERRRKYIDMAFEEAFSEMNTKTYSSCRSCRTDDFIQASPERVIVCAWQDFGPEGMVSDPDWGAITLSFNSVHHRPGSVRELYGQHEHNGEIY
ncbi:hypothetical protein V8C37DRAFT_407217 [Trichoderma ceciliae]